MRHEWILEGLPPNILVHHMNLHQIKDHELPKHIRQNVIWYREELENNAELNSIDSKNEITPWTALMNHEMISYRSKNS